MHNRKLKIMLVDDDIRYLRCIKEYRLLQKWKVVTALCAEDAISAIGESDFDLIITDL